MKLKRSQNPGGHKEGRASFPIKSQYKNLVNPYLESYPREEKGRKRGREGEGAGRDPCVRALQAREKERE